MNKKKLIPIIAGALAVIIALVVVLVVVLKDDEPSTQPPTPPAAELNQAPELQDGQVLFTIYAKDQNGDAVKGVKLQACKDDGNCLMSTPTTDDEGKAYFAVTPSEGYKVKIFVNALTNALVIPEGYTYADTEPEKYPMTATTATTITFTLTKVN